MKFPSKISHFLSELISNNLSPVEEELQSWRERIINVFSLIFITLGFIVLVPSVWLSIREQLWGVAVFDVAIYGWIASLYFTKSFGYRIRILSMVTLSYLLGVVLLGVVGPFGAGPVWLFFFPVLTGLLMRLRPAIIALCINMITLFAYWCLITQYPEFWLYQTDYTFDFPFESWLVILLNFMLLNTITTVAVNLVVQGLQKSLTENRHAYNELEAINLELGTSNRLLKNEIEAKKVVQFNLRKSERALKESEIRFKELINFLPLGYFLVDDSYQIRFINETAHQRFNFDRHEDDGSFQFAFNILDEQEQQKARKMLSQALTGSVSSWTRFDIKNSSEGSIPVETHISPIIYDNEVIAAQGLIVDISERLEKEKLRIAKDIAEQANKAISEWVAFIAHEIRTPITALLSYAQLGIEKINRQSLFTDLEALKLFIDHSLAKQTKNDNINAQIKQKTEQFGEKHVPKEENLNKYFNRILSSSNRLNLLLNELLDLSKLESGQMEFSIREVTLHAIVKEAAVEMEAFLTEKNLSLEMPSPDFDTELECDAFRIGQVIRNLLSNAIKFSPSDKTISIQFYPSEIKMGRRKQDPTTPAIDLIVRDEGVGIPVDQLTRIFEKFKQSRKTRIGEGTGLGLPICREIVTAHNGLIVAENNPSGGAGFRVTLPLKQNRPPTGTIEPPPETITASTE
jgi:PAS domain S-box-containing protein